jgi:threonine dehydratase
MPSAAPPAKIEAVRGYGAEVVLEDDRARLFPRMNEIREARGLTVVPPFDHPDVVAGAATVALEVLEDLPDVELFVVPVGGGGLISGTVAAARAVGSSARIVGVEIAEYPGLAAAIQAGKPVTVPKPAQTWMDGLTAPFVGDLPFAVVSGAVDDVVAVTEDEALAGMKAILTDARLLVEGAGAAATAALLAGKVKAPPGTRTVAMASGGNVDVERFARALTG